MAKNRLALFAVGASILVIAFAGCGDDDDSSDDSGSTTAATTSSADASTVSVQSIGGTDVLVDSSGNALYTNDMDSGSKVQCTGECTSIWVPLEATSGQPTSDDSSVEGSLGTVDLPDGTTQVTFDGKPLYTFTQDSPGEDTGDGVSDSFGGVSFVWTVASPSGGSSSDSGSSESTQPTTTDSGSSGYGY